MNCLIHPLLHPSLPASTPNTTYIKRLLSDGFNMAAIGNSLLKSHSSQTLSCTLYDHKTVILLENFSSCLNNLVYLSKTFLLNVFHVSLFFHKNAFLTFFIVGVCVYLCTSMLRTRLVFSKNFQPRQTHDASECKRESPK